MNTKQLLCVVIFSSVVLLSKAGSDVIDLNEKNFNELVLGSELPFMVEFFAPWCGHCKALAPEWEKAATNLKGLLPVGKVDCTVHQNLCGKYGVKGYPTIKCFSEKGKKVADYQQARQASAIVRYASDLIPDRIARVKDSSSLDKFLQKTPELPHVILFTAKSDVSPLFKSLAVKFTNKILFGQVKKGITDVEQKYNVQSFPTIVSVTGENVANYDGAISSESLGAWLSGIAGEEVTPPAEEAKPKPRAKPKVVETAFVEATTENFDTLCSASLCVVGAVDVVTEGERAVNPEQNQILTNILGKWNKDGKFKFVWVDRASAKELVAKFSLGEPAFFVYNGKRAKFAKADSFDEVAVHRLLEHVIAGDVKYTQL